MDVTVADCAPPPVDKACGEGIMPDGLAAARSLGLDLDSADGYRFHGIRFCDGERSVATEFPHGSGLGLRRPVLHRLMLERAAAAGVRLLWGVPVSGISVESVSVADRGVRTRWIVGADGGRSQVRRWAGLDACRYDFRRFGFRRHYRVAPSSRFMEIHWGDRCQIYVTPVSDREVCVVLISRDSHLRLDEALTRFPQVQDRLSRAETTTAERGGISASRRLRRVCRGNVALVGDASGSVDAITGEGLCLLFQQAVALAHAFEAGDLSRYQTAHRQIGFRPELMAHSMLLLDRSPRLRHRAIGAMAAHPGIFSRLLATHVGEKPAASLVAGSLALGWRMLTL
jgi:flavin-dependent dehydrogenase